MKYLPYIVCGKYFNIHSAYKIIYPSVARGSFNSCNLDEACKDRMFNFIEITCIVYVPKTPIKIKNYKVIN